jgi:acetyl-CoA carboxylase carboxyltransferase component
MPLGIVANQTPIINPDEAMKGAQFVRMCNQENTPILFLHNVTGFMVGSKVEHASIIKKGAQFVSAVSCSKVPHISIILGASYGAGNYAMCGRTYKPRFMFTWPIGRCSVMGAEQLSGVMEQIEANSAKSRGIEPNPEQVRERTRRHREEVERDSRCYRTSAMLIDDGIIDPRDTRDVLGMCLEIVQTPGVEGTAGHRALARI